MNKQVPLVSIICNTYNHEPYIRQCIEGFVMQKTTFTFEILIHDDASIDKTADIIKEYEIKYPQIIKPIYQTENQYSKGIKIQNVFQYPRVKGKYIALCEGDDYWIDPLKLQKQVDFLEQNPEYSMCFHRSSVVNELDINPVLNSIVIEDKDYSAEELFEKWIVPTASIVYRSKNNIALEKYIKPKRILNGDIVLILNCAQQGKIRGFSDTMAVYRMHSNGVTYDVRLCKYRIMKYPDHYLFIKDNFPMVSKVNIYKSISKSYINRIFIQEHMTDKIKDFSKAIYYHPLYAFVFSFKCLMVFIRRFKCKLI